ANLWQERLESLARGDDHELRRGRPHGPLQIADDVDGHSRVVRVQVGLGPVPLDDQLIVQVRLDVEVALARKPDHLHRKVVPDALVEEHLAAQRADLRALVADDRTVEAEELRPGRCAGVRAPGAGHDLNPRVHAPGYRRHVTRIQLQRGAEDRAVEIEGQEAIRRGGGYRFTS